MPTVGKIKVDLFGDTRQFQRGMRSARRTVRRFSDDMRGLQRRLAFIGGSLGFGLLLRRTADEAILMKQLADRVDANVERFSKLARVLSRSGIEFSQTGTILQRMVRRAGEAAAGNEALQEAFGSLGISVTDFLKLDPVEAFIQLGEALSQVDDRGERLLTTFRILDTEGVRVLQTDLKALRGEVAKTSGITDGQAKSVTEAAAAWDKLKESFSSAALTFGQQTGAIGVATQFFEGAEKMAKSPIAENLKNAAASLAGIVPFFGGDLQNRILSGRAFGGAETAIRRIGPNQFVGGDLGFDLLSGMRRPTGQIRGEGLPPLPEFGAVRETGVRRFEGGDLERTNRLLEQIRANTGKPQGAVAQ